MVDLFVELTRASDSLRLRLNVRYVIRYESDPGGTGSIIYLTCKVNQNDFITVKETPLEIARRMVDEWDLKFERTPREPEKLTSAIS